MSEAKNVGYDIKAPDAGCSDKKCPFHGDLKVHGKVVVGIVISMDVHNSAVIELERKVYVRKYERYMTRRSKIHVHSPRCINASIGDKVRVVECRQISKTKNMVVVEKIAHDESFKERQAELQEEEKKSFKYRAAVQEKAEKAEKKQKKEDKSGSE